RLREVLRLHHLSRGRARGLRHARSFGGKGGRPARQGLGAGAEFEALLPGDRQGQRSHHRDPEIHHQHGERDQIEAAMKWTDTLEIAIALSEKYPDVDPLTVRFTDLFEWVQGLDEFDDDPKHCGEKILEAIQMAWIEEVE